MKLSEWIKNHVLKLFGKVTQIDEPKTSERLTYINDEDAIRVEKCKTNKIWYTGNGDELMNRYLNKEVYGWASNPIYNRNQRNYFWGESEREHNIKRVHSGLPKAMIDTLVNAIGMPDISADVEGALTDDARNELKEKSRRLHYILNKNDFTYKLIQQGRPLTMVEGWGAYKINIDKAYSDVPIIEFVDAINTEFVLKSGIIVAIIFKSYYKDDKNRDYLLLETRRLCIEGSVIEYKLFRVERNDEVTEVPFDTLKEFEGLDMEPKIIKGLNKLTAVPSKYFNDPMYSKGGKSLFDGKLDVFDSIDMMLSQLHTTGRVSTPVEYYDTSLLQRTKNGVPILPERYDRQYVAMEGVPNGDGESGNPGILTTQPDLNFEQYNSAINDLTCLALTGVLSPATMGIDLSKRDNAEAQREKEKVTIMTRNNIIDRETSIIRELCEILLWIDEYMNTGEISLKEIPISVKYDEFANPSFETELQMLGSAWNQGEISTEKYVELLWGDKLSKEEMIKEMEWLEKNRLQDDLGISNFEVENDRERDQFDNEDEASDDRDVDEAEEKLSNDNL